MREIANESEDRLQEMRAFLMLARTLQHMTNYKQAVVVLKRLLQLAWCENNFEYEMKAYEMTAKQYFYL